MITLKEINLIKKINKLETEVFQMMEKELTQQEKLEKIAKEIVICELQEEKFKYLLTLNHVGMQEDYTKELNYYTKYREDLQKNYAKFVKRVNKKMMGDKCINNFFPHVA